MTTPPNETARLLEGLREIQDYIWRLPQEEACAAYAIADRLLTGTPYHIDPDMRAPLATLGAEDVEKECPECAKARLKWERKEQRMARAGNFGIVPLPRRCKRHTAMRTSKQEQKP